MSAGGQGALWLVVPSRFCGPPQSGNGGWTAGALAAHAAGGGEPGAAVTVTLRTPPPLDVAMTIERAGEATRALRGDTLVAEAAPAEAPPDAVPPVDAATAREAQARFAGLAHHPFPTCFVCGPGREEGDGLRIFPGPVEPADGQRRVAATWTPHPSLAGPPPGGSLAPDDPGTVSLAIAWAALDCIGGWSAEEMGERAMVLGRMTAAVEAQPRIGEEHVVVGSKQGTEGRRTSTSSTLYDGDGRVVARAAHTWIAVDPAHFG